MEARGKGKRPLPDSAGGDDDAGGEPPAERKPRFPKGKKARPRGDGPGEEEDEAFGSWMDPRLAAKERSHRRTQIREAELFRGGDAVVSAAEVHYEDNTNFEDDGIQIDPFNLKQEREEGYFDENGNFVEYASQNETKDAWLDSVEVDTRFAEKFHEKNIAQEDYQELSSEDVAKLKRNIANVLEPGETILQALKRLKGTSGDKRAKMPEGVKRTFDQLTEDAMKLMENGDYNVYHEKQETFEREAEGYERLARVREGALISAENGTSGAMSGEDHFSNNTGYDVAGSSIWDMPRGASENNMLGVQVSSSAGGDTIDMFGEDDEDLNANPKSDGSLAGSGSTSEQIQKLASESLESTKDLNYGGGGLESDYIFDQSSGYYYNSSLGYYYDPASGLYCCATSGKWYAFDEQNGSYVEIQNAASKEAEGA